MPDRPAILQVSTTDRGGGAARVAWNLFAAYRSRGYPAWLAVGRNHTRADGVVTIPNERHRPAWARLCGRISERLQRSEVAPRLARGLGRIAAAVGEPARYLAQARGHEDFAFPGSRRILSLTPRAPDVLHLHNLHGRYFDLRILPELSRRVPVLLTLHDGWLLSGHCAHSLACERWKTGCGACPDLSLYPSVRRDATAYNWVRKRDVYRQSRVHVATPSRWLMTRVEESVLAPAVVEAQVVPNGVDLRHFRPGERLDARDKLGLPHDGAILLTTGTAISRNVWKDYPTLMKAAGIIAESVRRHVILLIVGEKAPDQTAGRADVRFVPYEDDPLTVARYYQAADVYVHAARADTFPSSVLEALACGTPVVATAVGGIVEQIVDGRTGFLVPPADFEALAARAAQVLTTVELRRELASEAVRDARDRFGLDRQVDAYLGWYERLLSTHAPYI